MFWLCSIGIFLYTENKVNIHFVVDAAAWCRWAEPEKEQESFFSFYTRKDSGQPLVHWAGNHQRAEDLLFKPLQTGEMLVCSSPVWSTVCRCKGCVWALSSGWRHLGEAGQTDDGGEERAGRQWWSHCWRPQRFDLVVQHIRSCDLWWLCAAGLC